MQKIKKAPFYKDSTDSKYLMLDVIIALIPVVIMAVVKFGLRALFMMVITVASCVLFEWLWNKLRHQDSTIGDLSACVTGLLLALSFAVTVPYWVLVFASFVSIIVIKQLPGGIGKNTFNPAVFGRVLCKITLTPFITNWVSPLPDMVSAATPLEFIGNGVGSVPAICQC